MILPVFLPHLGCSEKCTYCDQRFITNLKESSLGSIIDQTLNKHKGPYEVGIFGGNVFGIKPAELRKLFLRFKPYRDRITNFRISTKPVPLNNEINDILKSNGVSIIELGIPTFNDRILAKLNRRHSAADLIKAFDVLTGEGFNVALQFMTGLPDETMADIEIMVEHMVTLKPYYIRIYPLVVFANTPLGLLYAKGFFTPPSFDTVLDRAVYIYLNALKEGISVVKMGLTDNEVIKENILAGQYHPSYGFMVKSRAFYLALMAKLCCLPPEAGRRLAVYLNSRDIPHLLGHRRTNIERFASEGIVVNWQTVDIDRGSFILCYGGQSVEGTILDGIEMFSA